MLFRGYSLYFPALQRRLHRVPGQARTFHPGRIFPNSGKHGQPCREVIRSSGLTVTHPLEVGEDFAGLLFRLALDHRRHQRGRGLRDGASRTLEAGVGDLVSLELAPHGEGVTAERVVPIRVAVGSFHHPEVARCAVVVQDQVLVELAEITVHPNTFRTSPSASTSASTSSRRL